MKKNNTEDVTADMNSVEVEDHVEVMSAQEEVIKDQPEAKAETKKAEKTSQKVKDAAYWDERIDYIFPLDFSQPNIRDKTIIVNGYPFRIQLGKTVNVPRYVIRAYQDSEEQRMRTLGLQDKYTKRVDLGDYS